MRTILLLSIVLFILLLATSATVEAAQLNPTPTMLLLLSPARTTAELNLQARLFPTLKGLRAQNHLMRYEWLADANAIRVQGMDAVAAQILYAMPGIARVTPQRAEILDAARQQQQNLERNLRGTNSRAEFKRATPTAGESFNIHETWDMFQASGLSAGQAVTAVLKDSGANTKDTLNVNADADGNINSFFGADVVQGDSVDISYDSNNVTIQSDAITIDFDYANDHVMGTAGANRTIVVNVRGNQVGGCDFAEYSEPTTSDGSGNYDADLSGDFDVLRRTESDVTSVDANGNGWSIWRHAPWLLLRRNENNARGFALAPDEDVDIVLKNGGTDKATRTPHSNSPDANFGFDFWEADMLAGDTLTATEGGNTWATINLVPLSVYFNPANEQVTGTAPANAQVVLRSDHLNLATGDYESACQTVTANGSGNFSATFNVPYIGADVMNAFYPDTDGFEQLVADTAPFLMFRNGENIVQGMFHSNFEGDVNVTVVNKKGDTKYQGKGYAFGGWWSILMAKNGAAVNLAAQDTVTATPRNTAAPQAAGTLSAKVAKLTAALDTTNDRVSGTTKKNTMLWLVGRKWYGDGYQCAEDCGFRVTSNDAGAYTHDFNQDLVAGDYAEVIVLDSQGHETIKRAFSTAPTITMNSFPATFRRGRPNAVKYTIANGVNVEDTGILADSTTRPDWRYTMQNGPEGNWWPGGPGQYTVNVHIAHQGKIYFRAFAWIDGRYIITNPESSARAR